jgi:protein dispatched 1
MSGLAICFPVVFAVLLFATGNIIVSVYAILSIAFIVGGVLGAAKLYSGTHTHTHTYTHTHKHSCTHAHTNTETHARTHAHTHIGWSLGVAESIAGVIVVGFSVDYTLHLGHIYKEAEHLTVHILKSQQNPKL